MYQENYKGFDINELYDEQQKPYYNIAKVFNDDPYYEIWGEDYQTIDDAKKAIDNVELPQWENLQLSSMLTASTQ